MPLTDIQIKQAQASTKDIWLTDEKGLRLLVKKNGSKYWRLKYRFQGKQKTLAIGVYPEVSLKDAREAVSEARRLLRDDIDPSAIKQEKKHLSSVSEIELFNTQARLWWNKQKGQWSEGHAARIWTRLNDNALKTLGKRPIGEITPQDIIRTVQKIETRGALDVAQRVLQDIRRVCRFAVQTGVLLHNPASELSGILEKRKTSHRASLPREELPQFLRDLDAYHQQGRLLTKLAIELLVHTFVRPGEGTG